MRRTAQPQPGLRALTLLSHRRDCGLSQQDKRRAAIGRTSRASSRPGSAGQSAASSSSSSSRGTSSSTDAAPVQLTAVASVDVGDAVEQLTVPVQSQGSSLLTVTLSMPMGLILEESQSTGLVVVVEVTPGGSAAAKNVREGDVVRGVTAASMQMTYPTMNLMLGGVGRPKLKRIALPVTGRPFAWLREAIKSNVQLPGNSVTLVLERAGSASSTAGAQQGQKQQPSAEGVPGQVEDKKEGLFDPRIFE